MAISSAGIGSGLDVNSIVSQLVAIERKPITQLQTAATKLQTQLSAFGRMQSALSTLRDAAVKLAQPTNWGATTATTSSADTVGATSVGGAAAAGNYTLVVDHLAASQTLVSGAYANASATLGSGEISIELGNFDAVPPVPNAEAAIVNIIIDPASSSLSGIRDKINAANAGVVASIVSDVTGSRLVLRSAATGEANGFRVQITNDDDGDAGDASGLSALAFDPSASIANMDRPQTALNAAATINGVAIESASNTLSGTIEGMTLLLKKAGTAEVQVQPDTEALKKSVDAFVTAYNEAIKLLREQTSYDPVTKKAGALQGDRASAAMMTQLRGMFTGTGGNSAVFSRMADIGLNLDTDGLIKTDSTKLATALTQPAEMSKLFANVDTVTPANQGFGKKLQGWLNMALDSAGTLDSRKTSLQERVRSNEQQQSRLEDRVANTEQRLLRQYSALDTRMGQLSGLSAYVTQQMAMLTNSNNN